MKGPRVVVAGEFAYDFYESAFCFGLRAAGAAVSEFRIKPLLGPGTLLYKSQLKLVFGPGIALANAAFVAQCARQKPDLVLAWRAYWLSPSAIRAARRFGAKKVVLYTNDDPFGPDRDLRLWRHFRKLIPEVDASFAYRDLNIPEYQLAGARSVGLLRSWYDPRLHAPVELSAEDRQRYGCDVVFIGHCEQDDRLELMEMLAASGLRIRLFGNLWERYATTPHLKRLLPTKPLLGKDYVKALAAAKMAVTFFSKRNRDQYTRRCFEVPAIGTTLLSPRTPEMLKLFSENEVAYFLTGDDLVAVAKTLAADDVSRNRIAAAGRRRCLEGGHDVVSRARTFLSDMGFR